MAASKEQILESISNMTIMDVVDLVKMMEDKFGVTAAAPVAVAAVAGGGAAAPAAEEKTEFTVTLKAYPADKKVGVIKVIREITGLGLKEGQVTASMRGRAPLHRRYRTRAAVSRQGDGRRCVRDGN
jgi:large subunit ribosomal protein L7/L12